MIYSLAVLCLLMLFLGVLGLVFDRPKKPEREIKKLPEPKKKSIVDDGRETFVDKPA